MSTNIEQAAKRNRKSMMELYCANKNSVYLFCKLLLGDEQKAAEATTSVFYENWHEVALQCHLDGDFVSPQPHGDSSQILLERDV